MKKLTVITAAITLLFSLSAFTGPGVIVPMKVQTSFEKNFSDALNINWVRQHDNYTASFLVKEVQVNAVYDEDGVLLGASRVIEFSTLPAAVTKAISTRFPDHAYTTSVTELNIDGTTSYFLTLQNDKKILKVKCSEEGFIQIEKRIKK